MDHQRCNIFRNVYDRDCSNVVHLYQIIEAIQQGRWKKQIEAFRNEPDKEKSKHLKFNLPCFTISGTFMSRSALGINDYSYLVVADIDDLSPKELERCKSLLTGDPHTLCYFESPSKGLKVIFGVSTGPEHHRDYAFRTMKIYLEGLIGIKLDDSGKDISRLCFVSYDPDLYINPNAVDIEVEVENVDEFYSVTINKDLEPSFDIDYVYKTCVKMIKASKTGGFYKGNRNNYIFCLASLCSEVGIPEQMTYSLISRQYSSLGKKEIVNTIRSAFKRTRGNLEQKL